MVKRLKSVTKQKQSSNFGKPNLSKALCVAKNCHLKKISHNVNFNNYSHSLVTGNWSLVTVKGGVR